MHSFIAGHIADKGWNSEKAFQLFLENFELRNH